MKGTVSVLLAGTGAVLASALVIATMLQGTTATPPPTAPSPFSGMKVVDLTYPFNSQTPFWPGDRYTPFDLKTIATLEQDGVLSKAISLPEHLGTHLDAPNHFEANQPSVDAILPEHLVGPGVVIDQSLAFEQQPDSVLTLEQLHAWEREHGEIPSGAIVFLATGWSQFWTNPPRYMNKDMEGKLHFPGYSAEAAKFLIEERQAKGLGIDTLSIDPGNSRDFIVHHLVNRAQRYGLENVAGLDKLPPRGFWVVVAPMKIEHGTGGPTRILAFVPEAQP